MRSLSEFGICVLCLSVISACESSSTGAGSSALSSDSTSSSSGQVQSSATSSGGGGSSASSSQGAVSDTPPSDAASKPIPKDAYSTTTPGGYFSISQSRTLAISNDQRIAGFAEKNGNLLMFVVVSLGSNLSRWKILSTTNYPGSAVASWQVACDILSDGTARIGLAADDTYYYLPGTIASDQYHKQYLRRFRVSDCVEVSALDTGRELATGSDSNYVFSIAENQLFYKLDTNNPASIVAWNISRATVTSQVLNARLAGVVLDNPTAMYVSGQFIWALKYSTIWKLDLAGNVIAWGNLPYSLYDSDAVIPVDLNTVMLAQIYNASMTRTFIDVSRF